jgi:hypothetical protein
MLTFIPLLLAQAADPFGKIDSPVGTFGNNPGGDLGNLIGVGLVGVIALCGMAALAYALWGALTWIMAAGDKEKLRIAQGRIRDALIGIFVLVLVFAVFALLMQTVLGGRLIQVDSAGIHFSLPSIDKPGVPAFPN